MKYAVIPFMTILIICSCTTNMPLRNIAFPRNGQPENGNYCSHFDVNTHYTGITDRKYADLPGINSTAFGGYFLNYYSEKWGFGGYFTFYRPYEGLAPYYGDAWDGLDYISVSPLAFIVSRRLINTKIFTLGVNIYPLSFPLLFGSASLITTFHLPADIDIFFNLHSNPTLLIVLPKVSWYKPFSEMDLGIRQTFFTGNRFQPYYSVAVQRYRGIISLVDFYESSTPPNTPFDIRYSLSLGMYIVSP